jgi:hypothetical protein
MNIKLFALFLFLLAVISTESYANRYGVKVGLNYSDIPGKIDFNKYKIGYCLGYINYFQITENFDIQVELQYATKGAILTLDGRTEFGEMGGTFDLVYHFAYIEIPVLVKYKIGLDNSKHVGLFLGPQFSILTSAFWDIQDPENIGIEGRKRDIRDDTNNFDYGITCGLSYPFSISKLNCFVDIRYNLSLNKLWKSDESDWNWAHHQLLYSAIGINF